MTLTIAIVGRPNVGKSTLFNRLVGRRLALVDDTPGVTRDRRAGEARIADLAFRIIDTAGLDEAPPGSLTAGMMAQTERAVADADLALFLIDARAGITPIDRHFSDWLRNAGKPVILVANKCEGSAGRDGLYEAFDLGHGEPVAVSAEHGEGMAELYDALASFEPAEPAEDAGDPDIADDDGGPIHIAIAGRPNVGKSTLANALIGEERLLTGPEAGVTRDAIAVDWSYGGRDLRLVDTAGLRRRANVTEKLEKLSVADARRAIGLAQVVILVIDGAEGLHKQDLTIARQVVDEGRSLVLVANKWDLIADAKTRRAAIVERLEQSLPQVRGVRLVTLSALRGTGLKPLMKAVFQAYDTWNRRVPTGRLNRWLEGVLQHHPPPLASGRRIKIRYMTQVKARPPTFAVFMSKPQSMPDAYTRYLVNGLRETFDLPGVPIRLLTRKGRNPYVAE